MKKFERHMDNYPSEMRRQLWPLCCGASIISGFKTAHTLDEDELVKQINSTIDDFVPDLQVFSNETICPKLIYLTLNSTQMASPKIMNAIKRVGFVQFAVARPRGSDQGFFVFDKSKTFALITTDVKVQATA
jgi:hypothetical protein